MSLGSLVDGSAIGRNTLVEMSCSATLWLVGTSVRLRQTSDLAALDRKHDMNV